MIESELAKQWATLPDFPNRLTSWIWFKSAVSDCLINISQRLNLQYELRDADLANAFFQWVSYADNTQDFSEQDPVDYAHYACGVLLSCLIQAQPITVINKKSSGHADEKSPLVVLDWPDDLVVLCLTLTFLESWRFHLGTTPLVINIDLIKNHWNSFHENAREDTFSTVSFLDLFLGLPPVWGNSMSIGNRPAMRLAQERLQGSRSERA